MYFSGIISDALEAFRICGKRQQKCAIVNEKNTIILEGSRDGTAGYCGRKGKSDTNDTKSLKTCILFSVFYYANVSAK